MARCTDAPGLRIVRTPALPHTALEIDVTRQPVSAQLAQLLARTPRRTPTIPVLERQGPVPQLVFKTSPAWQPHACSVRLRGRSALPGPRRTARQRLV